MAFLFFMILTTTDTTNKVTITKCYLTNFYNGQKQMRKPKKTRHQADVQNSLKFQKEPSLDDSFWIVGVQTNYFYKKNFWH